MSRSISLRARRPPGWSDLRQEPLLAAMVAVFAVAYAAVGIIRHESVRSSWDLGIFHQAVWHLSRFENPESTVRGVDSLFGDHFHPIIALFAPLYWVWPDARVLLIAQAVLVAAAAVPVLLFARPRVGRAGALLLALAYCSFWGIAQGVAFDFHEVAVAPLLLAVAVLAADRGRWRAYAVAIALLLATKESFGLVVVFVGAYVALGGRWRTGALTAVAGIAWFLVATKVLIPAFSGGGSFDYWFYGDIGTDLVDAVGNVWHSPFLPLEVATDNPVKTRTLTYLLAPFLGLLLWSRLGVIGLGLIAERMLSTRSVLWGTGLHYSMAIAPILAMGAADGLANLSQLLRLDERRRALVVLAACFAIVVLNVQLARHFPLRWLADGESYRLDARERAARRALEVVPDGASVMAQSAFIPHLAARRRIYPVLDRLPPTDYVIADLADRRRDAYPTPSFEVLRDVVAERARTAERVFEEQGVVVLRRRAGG